MESSNAPGVPARRPRNCASDAPPLNQLVPATRIAGIGRTAGNAKACQGFQEPEACAIAGRNIYSLDGTYIPRDCESPLLASSLNQSSDRLRATAPSKRDQLLEAAEELFSTRGFANTRIAEIAAAAGTGISTFYRYFPTKDALLGARIAERFGQLRGALTEVRADVENRPPAEQLAVTYHTFELGFDALIERPKLTQMLFTSGFGASEEVRTLVQGLLAEAAADIEQVLSRIEVVSGLRIPAKSAVAQAAIGGILHLAHTHVCVGRPRRDEAVSALTTMFVGSIAISNPAWAAESQLELKASES